MLPLADLVARYLRFREIGKKLNDVLVAKLSRDVLEEGGRDLGFLRKGVFVFDSEDESAILMDYCIYNVLRQDRNQVQIFLAQNSPPEGSDEALLWHAMTKAWYSIFAVEKVEPGAGVRVQDVFRHTEHLLLDIGFGQSAAPGYLLGSRVKPMDGFIMTTGAALPLTGDVARGATLIGELTKVFFGKNSASLGQMAARQEKELARAIISAALSRGASSRIRYLNPVEQEHHPRRSRPLSQRLVPVLTGGRTGRNDRCPCGSGKKFKLCCARCRYPSCSWRAGAALLLSPPRAAFIMTIPQS
jgi:hypothetical protein